MPETDELTPDEERFVDEYLIDRNGTAAYIRVHPKAKRMTASTEAYRLLKKPHIAKAVTLGNQAIARRAKVSQDTIVRGFARLAFYDIGSAMDLSKDVPVFLAPRHIPYEVRQAIQSVKITRRKLKSGPDEDYEVENVEYKFADKLNALDKLSRHLGLYKDLTPLEVLLALLPAELREPVRASLAQSLLESGGAISPGPDNATGTPSGSLISGQPGAMFPGVGHDSRPVADGVPVGPGEAATDAMLSPSGEKPRVGGEDVDALFE